MTKFILRIQILLTAFFVLAVSGFAQQVQSEIQLYKVLSSAEGKEQLVKADSVQRNDLLEYQLLYKNTGSSAVTDIKAVLPVPSGMKLVMLKNKEGVREPKVSLTGTSWHPYPIMEEVSGSDGKEINKKPVNEELYRFLQWRVLKLDPGDQQILRVRMLVL